MQVELEHRREKKAEELTKQNFGEEKADVARTAKTGYQGKTVGKIIPAEAEDIETFPGRMRLTLKVKNTGDRAIQVGSHFHFFEANRNLEFDRG
ncbi:MAG: urease subunit beta, partial [Rhabdochlamydiaceae bacterium]